VGSNLSGTGKRNGINPDATAGAPSLEAVTPTYFKPLELDAGTEAMGEKPLELCFGTRGFRWRKRRSSRPS
jgi:hypothetical protein